MRSNEIQEQMRNKIVDMYQSGKGHKAISKALGLQGTMVRDKNGENFPRVARLPRVAGKVCAPLHLA